MQSSVLSTVGPWRIERVAQRDAVHEVEQKCMRLALHLMALGLEGSQPMAFELLKVV